jgi:hypothetical protein
MSAYHRQPLLKLSAYSKPNAARAVPRLLAPVATAIAPCEAKLGHPRQIPIIAQSSVQIFGHLGMVWKCRKSSFLPDVAEGSLLQSQPEK